MTIRTLTAALSLVWLCATLCAAAPIPPDAYAKVRVDLSAPGAIEQLREHGALDVRILKPGSHAELIAGAADLAWLRTSGLRFDVVVDDLTEHYIKRLDPVKSAAGENYGDYHTYSEVVAWLDELHALYPDVISEKWSIGQSHEGRDLWCIRVSDNPEIDEIGEAEVLFDGMHHAREIMASETCMMLAEYLATRYGGDPDITYLLDTREIYIVPVVNPDGSVYNESISPAGGGMWRKNRRDNGDGTYGVDPNRNYPYQWATTGSSFETDNDLYHGPSAGSEPEVQAMMTLVNAHEFITSQSFHSYSNLTLYPWGYTSTPCADDVVFAHMGDVMTRYNGYISQASASLYPASGTTPDWIYGDQTNHPMCYAFLNEIGSTQDGFWPEEARRDALFEENLWPSLYQIMAADHFLEAHAPQVVGGDGDGYLDPGESAGIAFLVENYGVVNSATDVSLSLSTADPYLQLFESERNLADLAPMEVRDLVGAPFALQVDPACPVDRLIEIEVLLNWSGTASTFSLFFRCGAPELLLSDDLEGGLGDWTLGGNWATTTALSHSATTSLCDSPSGNYSDQTTTSATLNPSFPLPAGASLSYWHRYQIEDGWDYGYLKISTDGTAWTTLASYTGEQDSWTQQEQDLSGWAGQSVQLRFELVTDYSVTADGWYLDDIAITGYGDQNLLPEPPALVYPGPGESVGMIPGFTVSPSVDPDSADPVTYGFRVYGDPQGLDLIAAGDDIEYVFWTPALGLLQQETQYWWRAYAADSQARGLMGPAQTFTTLGSGLSSTPIPISGLRLDLETPAGAPQLRFALGLPTAGEISVKIYNARGQLINTLASGYLTEGRHLLVWDGQDLRGRSAASGVYFVNARQDGQSVTRRILRVR